MGWKKAVLCTLASIIYLVGVIFLHDKETKLLSKMSVPIPLRTALKCNWTDRGFFTDPYSITLSIDEPELCLNKNVYLLIYIYSSARNTERRDRIRQTWGSEKGYPGKSIAILFIIASDKIPARNSPLKMESETHRDMIILDNVIEDYNNVLYKGLVALKWILINCYNISYVIKTDDDCIVNTVVTKQEIIKKKPFGFNGTEIPTLSGRLVWRGTVIRTGHWGVSKDEYPGRFYPPYAIGTGVIMSLATISALYKASFNCEAHFLHIDDVFMNGILPQLAGNVIMKELLWHTLYKWPELNNITKTDNPEKLYNYMFAHIFVRNEDLFYVALHKMMAGSRRQL